MPPYFWKDCATRPWQENLDFKKNQRLYFCLTNAGERVTYNCMKCCTQCGETKPFTEFYKHKLTKDSLHYWCKSCYNARRKKYQSYKYSQENYLKNKNKIIKKLKKWKLENKDKVKIARLKYKVKKNLTRRIKLAMQRQEISLDKIKLYDCNIGCSVKELREHLESKMLTGMTWDNYGSQKDQWSIDHIKPIDSFDLEQPDQIAAANHFSNLQPLWSSQNIRKFNHYDPDHPMGWHGLNELLSEEDKRLLSERFNYSF